MNGLVPARRDARPVFLALAAVLAVLFVFCREQHFFSTLVLAGIYAISVLGLVLLIGLSGQFSLGHGAFMGIGAYASAVLTRHGVPPALAFFIAIAVTAAIAAAVALPIVRLKGHLLALGTLAFGIIVASVLNGWQQVTLGPSGIPDIPPISLGFVDIKGESANFIFVWSLALLVLWGSLNAWRSGFGRAALAVKRDEDAAAAMGIPVIAVKTKVFALSAAMAGMSGVLYANYVTFISPERFHLDASFELLLAALLGGVGTPYGAVAGALLLVLLPELVAPLRDYKVAVYGLVFIVVSLYLPHGLAGALEKNGRLWRRRAPGTSDAATAQ